mgnify:FL=1
MRNKKYNLLNYFMDDQTFIKDEKSLAKRKAYVAKCESFFKTLKNKPTKDNSVKTDYFVNCRCCKELITADFRSKLDKRYCLDCL